MKNKKNEYKYTAIYAGRRLDNKNKTIQSFFRSDNKQEMHFAGVKNVWIGHTYKCGANNISTRPERMNIERIDNAEWEAQDALVDAHNSRKRSESKIRSQTSPALKAARLALEPLFKNLRYYDRKVLIELLAEEKIIKRGKK